MASPTFFSDGHTPNRNDTKWTILQKILGATIDNGSGGGGGGTIEVTGANYRFNGSGAATELQLKNDTTGGYNPISATGADGSQTTVLDNSEA